MSAPSTSLKIICLATRPGSAVAVNGPGDLFTSRLRMAMTTGYSARMISTQMDVWWTNKRLRLAAMLE